MKPLLCIRHQPSAPLAIGERVLQEHGLPYHYLDAWTQPEWPELVDFSGLIVLGGEMHAHQTDEYPFLKPVRDITRAAVEQDLPVLGICLGSQILAAALGEDVYPSPVREIGFRRLTVTREGKGDRVLSVFAERGAPVFQWHQDTFDLPTGAKLLYSGEDVRNQAFRVGDRAYGVQFHMEVTSAEIHAWAQEAENDQGLREHWGISLEELLTQANRYLSAMQEAGTVAFARFCELVTKTSRGG